MSNRRFIEKATLKEIRKVDGAMMFEGDNGKIYWLTGWQRPSNVVVGDVGSIFYESSPSYGLHFFEKDNIKL